MKIKISFFSVLLLASLLLVDTLFAIAALVAIFLHELGHLLAAKKCGVKMSEFGTSIYGARLVPECEFFSYKDEIFICLMGPAINFLCFAFFMPIYFVTKNTFVLYFISSSIVFGVLNILPVKTFDGGRILLSTLCLFTSCKTASLILSVSSFILIFIFWSLSVYMLITAEAGLSMFTFSLSLFSKFFAKES